MNPKKVQRLYTNCNFLLHIPLEPKEDPNFFLFKERKKKEKERGGLLDTVEY